MMWGKRTHSYKHSATLVSFVLLFSTPNAAIAQEQNEWRKTLKRLASSYQQAPRTSEPAASPSGSNIKPPTTAPNIKTAKRDEAISTSDGLSIALPSQTPTKADTDSPAASERTTQLFAEPAPSNLLRFAAGEELILTVTAGGFLRGEIFATTTEKGLRVGLAELSELLAFPITVSDDNRQATGWFISPSNTIELRITDSGDLTANVKDNQFVVPSEEYSIEGDILLDLQELSTWFGLEFKLDEGNLALAFSSQTPFSFESAEQRRERAISGGYRNSESVLPQLDNGYRLYSPPLLDNQVFMRTGSGSTTYGYSIASRQDLGYLNTRLFISGDKTDSLRDGRLTLSRESPKGDLLGPLKLSEISIGDVLPINAGVGRTPAFGRGLYVSNITDQLADNRLINFTGVIQSGWDVELYRNGILLANEFDIQTGRYEFTDVELLFGNNDFELVFYGPQGEIQRKTESYVIDANALKANQSSFRMSLVDGNKTLLGIQNVTEAPELEGINTGLVYERGITNWYTLGVGASLFNPSLGDRVEQLSLRNNLSLGTFGLLNSVAQFDMGRQRNLLANYRTRLGQTNIAVNWQDNTLFAQSEEESDIDPAREEESNSRVTFIVSGRLFAGTPYELSHENTWNRNWNSQGVTSEQFRQSLSVNTRFGSFNHSLVGTRSQAADSVLADNWALSGNIGYRHRFGKLFARIFSNYEYQPNADIRSVGAAFRYPLTKDLSSELRYIYDVQSNIQRYDARVNWIGEEFSLTGFASFNDSDSWSMNLLARFSLGAKPDNEGFLLKSRPISEGGALSVRVFEDLDLDRQFDEGEPLLDNIEVQAAQVSRSDTTRDGTAFISRLPSNRRTDIVIDETTLPDYTFMRIDKGFSVTGRRGLLQFADIPLTRGGELDGTVYFKNKNNEEEPLPFTQLNLVDENDNIIAKTKSEYDGFYIFEKVIPGNYRLFIDASDLRQNNAIQEVTKRLDISNQGDLFTEVDVVLRELNQAKGHIAVVGNFKSLTLLKVYFQLLQKRLPSESMVDAFYLSPIEDEYFRLGIAYSEDESIPAGSCQRAASLELNCHVEYVEFGY